MASARAAVLPFSRAQESEADHIGLVYISSAGYDPRQALAFCAHDRVALQLERGGQLGVELELAACTLPLGMDCPPAPPAP
jgi:predicted Zn-dependent protease